MSSRGNVTYATPPSLITRCTPDLSQSRSIYCMVNKSSAQYNVDIAKCTVCDAIFKSKQALTSHLFCRSSKCRSKFYKLKLKSKARRLLRSDEDVSSSTSPISRNASDPPLVSMGSASVSKSSVEEVENRPISTQQSLDDEDSIVTDKYPGAAKIVEEGRTAHERITSEDKYSKEREQNWFYPFACFSEWEMAHWLSRAGLSQQLTNEFFKLRYVSLRGFLKCVSFSCVIHSDSEASVLIQQLC